MTSTIATNAAPTTNTKIAALKSRPVVEPGSSRDRVNATSRGCRRASCLTFGTLILGAVGAAWGHRYANNPAATPGMMTVRRVIETMSIVELPTKRGAMERRVFL